MFLIYDDKSVGTGGIPGPYNELPATRFFLNHYDNFLYLDFILKNTKDTNEKFRATKELSICEKKMAYWRKHPNFDQNEANTACKEAKKKWGLK